ncbi:hypothetical protein F0U44_06060 [Nocardioides humilatus]|uniref:HTH luxR-type domain-containing protein n=1 Tax=Nocardioides humilatus TaxID=2607660 RepID=A0A5B1LMC4_9ACTN|nr:LuxR C-terminal-related transcriptional regulator [Nocardioides humilatus]KAA1421831.1 hypothetical protein F0U44_06060 [Nocardioides humilatus]
MTVGSVFLAPFLGRVAESALLQEQVASHRLVTLLGPGGIGKTRLGYRLCDQLSEGSEQPVWSVDLAELADASVLGSAIAEAMGLPAASDQVSVEALADHIGDRDALLYLDNCEHLVDGCAELVTALLQRCGRLRVLTSSRQPLRVRGERVYPVPPMTGADARELFVDRATAALPEWSAVDEDIVDQLCAAVDAVPLAVELLATQVGVFAPDVILARVTDRVVRGGTVRGSLPRQQSVDACLQWSYDLCSEQERLLWIRASTFAGGFTIEGAEGACSGSGLAAGDVAGAIAGLVDKSVLARDAHDPTGRYRMLEIIRQYGHDRLDEAGEREVWRRRHRDYYLDLAELFERDWCGPRQKSWMDRWRPERANLRLAFDYSVSSADEAPCAMRMAAVCEHFFASTGGGGEALHWLKLALAHETGTDLERASALRIACFIANLVNDLPAAATLFDELEALAEESGDDLVRALMLYAGCVVRTWQNDVEAGARLGAEGIELLHRIGGQIGLEANLHFLRGMVLGWADQPEESAVNYRGCLDLTEPRGERWLSSYSAWGLGLDALLAGDVEEAIRLERSALEAKADFQDQLGIGLATEVLAWAAAAQRRGRDAAILLGMAESIWDAIGMSIAAMPYIARRREAGVADTRALLSGADFDDLVGLGRSLPQAEVVDIALGRRVAQPAVSAVATTLTKREREIARLVASGATNKAIAEHLVISVRTVESHVENLLRKLEVATRAQVADRLAELGV